MERELRVHSVDSSSRGNFDKRFADKVGAGHGEGQVCFSGDRARSRREPSDPSQHIFAARRNVVNVRAFGVGDESWVDRAGVGAEIAESEVAYVNPACGRVSCSC